MKHYYGWNIITALAITETVSWGILYYAFSVFIVPYEMEFGWSRAQVSGAFSMALLVSGAMAVPVGMYLDRYSSRGLMTVGSICAVGLYYLQSQITSLAQFYAVWIGIGAVMATVLYEPAFIVAAKWFERRRGTALAIITFAAGLASTIFLPLTTWLHESFGRIQAQRYLALLLAVITIPLHGLILRFRPQTLGLFPDGEKSADSSLRNTQYATPSHTTKTALRDSTFWWIATAFGLSAIAGLGIRVHMIPLLLERGFSAETAAWMTGIIGIAQVVGRIVYAPFGDRVSAKMVTIIVFAVQVMSIVALWAISAEIGVWLFVLLFGAAQGTITLARPAMIADLYGADSYGSISGVMAVTQRLVATTAPFGIGFLYTSWGAGYTPVLLVLIGLSILALFAMIGVREPTTITQ